MRRSTWFTLFALFAAFARALKEPSVLRNGGRARQVALFVFCLLFLCASSGLAQNRSLFFPQVADGRFADGSFYRSTLMIVPWLDRTTTCSLQFYGLTVALNSSTPASVFTITILTGSSYVGLTGGNQDVLQTGYATLNCSELVYANVLYSFYDAAGRKISEATVFGSSESSSIAFVLDSREGAHLGIAVANNTNLPRTYTLIFTGAGVTRSGTMQIPALQAIAKFADELMAIPENAAGVLRVDSGDASYFSAIALRYTGGVFTTIPASYLGLNLAGTWNGSASDSTGPARMTWRLAQTGTNVTGTLTATTLSGTIAFNGDFSGSLSGATLTFTINIPRGGISSVPNCTATVAGSATGVNNTNMSGTYTGTNSCTGPFTNGRFTLTRQ